MLKIMIFAIVGAFISSSALAGEWGGSGCSGIQQSVATAPSTPSATSPTTTAQTPIPKTTKPESKG